MPEILYAMFFITTIFSGHRPPVPGNRCHANISDAVGCVGTMGIKRKREAWASRLLYVLNKPSLCYGKIFRADIVPMCFQIEIQRPSVYLFQFL